MESSIQNILVEEPATVNIYDSFRLPSGRYAFESQNVKIQSLYVHGNSDRLYVFLNDAFLYKSKRVFFDRLALGDKLDGIKVFFDDASMHVLNMIPCCYYSILDDLEIIVRKIMLENQISPYNVVFVSSLCGGFAASYLAENIAGAKVIASDPIFSVMNCFPNRTRANEFLLKAGIANDENNKNNLRLFLKDVTEENISSSFVFIINLHNADSVKQISIYFNHYGVPSDYIRKGSVRLNNAEFIFVDDESESESDMFEKQILRSMNDNN